MLSSSNSTFSLFALLFGGFVCSPVMSPAFEFRRMDVTCGGTGSANTSTLLSFFPFFFFFFSLFLLVSPSSPFFFSLFLRGMSSLITPKPPSSNNVSRGSGRFGRRSRLNTAPHNNQQEDPNIIKIVDSTGKDVTPRSLLEPTRRKTIMEVKEEAEDLKFSMSNSWSQQRRDSTMMMQSTLPQFSIRSRSNSLISSMRSSFSLMEGDHVSVDELEEENADGTLNLTKDDDDTESISFDIPDEEEDNTLSDAELNKMVHIKIEETDTMFFFDLQPTWVDEEHAEKVTEENEEYKALLQKHAEMPDNFSDRFAQTDVVSYKQRLVQTSSTTTSSVQTQASQASIYDDLPKSKGLFKKRASRLLGKLKKSKSVHVRAGATGKTAKELGFGVVLTSYDEDVKKSVEDQWKDAQENSRVEQLFELMERLLQHEDEAEEQCKLWDGVVDSLPEIAEEVIENDQTLVVPLGNDGKENKEEGDEKDGADENDEKDGNASAHKEGTGENKDHEGEEQGGDDQHPTSNNNKETNEGGDKADTTLQQEDDDNTTTNIDEEEFDTLSNTSDQDMDCPLQRILTYKCEQTKGACVTCFAWNEQFSHILAVGYSIGGDASVIREGLVLCWSVKQPHQPHRIYRLSTSVMSIAFSKDNPMLMAVGCANGQLCMFDTKTGSSEPLLDTTMNDPKAKHTHAIWGLQFTSFDSKEGADTTEVLISSGIDGVVFKWTFHKGLEPVPLIRVKRVIRETKKKGGSLTKTAFIARQAGVTAFDFSPTDKTSYIVGTEDGNLHRCATAYTDSYLSTCFAHNGVVNRIAFNPISQTEYLTCSVDWSVKVWSSSEEEPLYTLLSKHNPIEDAAWSFSNEKILASVCDDTLFLWDLAVSTQDPVAQYVPAEGRKLKRVVFNKHRNHLVVGDSAGDVYVFKVKEAVAETGDTVMGSDDEQEEPKQGENAKEDTTDKEESDKLPSINIASTSS
eukprot:m.192668 g.192668  ORF g.192668 m.192668 type:complete len:965 (+) comp13652_c2_seq18:2310-5204(+)